MTSKRSIIYTLIAGLFMLVLILDSRTALSGASNGVLLCSTTIIPSIFPFFVISVILTGLLSVQQISLFRPLGKFLHLPENAEIILLIGFLGGYPVGAQCIAQAYSTGNLSRRQAERMLSFCSNAGPAFLFGIGGTVLYEMWACWLLWLIHIISAVFVGLLTPAERCDKSSIICSQNVSITGAVNKSMQIMASVCGWIILFRTILAFLQRWIFWLIPEHAELLISGLLELANGCTNLSNISSAGLRFQLFSIMLGFGGLCVALQTHSVLTGSGLSIRPYLLGKLTQAAISYLLCSIIQPLLPNEMQYAPNIVLVLFALLACVCYRIYCLKNKKEYSIPARAVV